MRGTVTRRLQQHKEGLSGTKAVASVLTGIVGFVLGDPPLSAGEIFDSQRKNCARLAFSTTNKGVKPKMIV